MCMKSVNIKKSVIFCAFSLNVNNIFCNNKGICGIWSGNEIIEHEKGDKDRFIDNIINNKDLKIKDSGKSLINDNGSSFGEDLVNCFENREGEKGVLTEFKYNDNFYYFFSKNNLTAEDFLEKPTSDEKKVFAELSGRNFKKINVEVKNGKLIVKKINHFTPNPNIGQGKKPIINNQGNPLPGTYTGKDSTPSTGSDRGKGLDTKGGFSETKSNNKEPNKIPSEKTKEDNEIDKNKKIESEFRSTSTGTTSGKESGTETWETKMF